MDIDQSPKLPLADIVEGPRGSRWCTHRIRHDRDIIVRRASAQGLIVGDLLERDTRAPEQE